jgi:hypothetical protein
MFFVLFLSLLSVTCEFSLRGGMDWGAKLILSLFVSIFWKLLDLSKVKRLPEAKSELFGFWKVQS